MTADLPITGWAVTGTGAEHAPAHRQVELPPAGTRRQGGRLPLLASRLARLARGDDGPDDPATAVLFGTGLGCLTETALFVEHMVAAAEATPKPRAFAASVHNAIAAKVALDLQARGECQTFAHGSTAFGHALFAAGQVRSRSGAPLLVGALDEASPYVGRGLRACGVDTPLGEGGAVLHAGPGTALATVRGVAFGRPRDPDAWLARHRDPTADLVRVPEPADPARSPGPCHPSWSATAVALAVGILAGEVAPAALQLARRGPRIELLTRSRFGDLAWIRLEAG